MDKENNFNSRNIPLAIQREVRKRCGFGCVICGLPLYEYEHMQEWSKVKRHVADEITILCDRHHREKTNGLLPKEKVAEANISPYNFRENVSKPYNLYFSGKNAEVVIGGNSFNCDYKGYEIEIIPILIDSIPIVGIILDDGHFLLNVILYDQYNNPVLQIKDNQLYYSIEPWDIQFVGAKLIIRQASRNILIEFEFQPPNKIVISRGRILCNGIEIIIRPDHIFIVNNNTFIIDAKGNNCHGGLIIGQPIYPINGFMDFPNINRYTSDKKEALKFERETKNILDKHFKVNHKK